MSFHGRMVIMHIGAANPGNGTPMDKGLFPRDLFERGSCMVWEINMGVCPHLDFDNIILFYCLGYNFNIYGAFEFLCNSIANL